MPHYYRFRTSSPTASGFPQTYSAEYMNVNNICFMMDVSQKGGKNCPCMNKMIYSSKLIFTKLECFFNLSESFSSWLFVYLKLSDTFKNEWWCVQAAKRFWLWWWRNRSVGSISPPHSFPQVSKSIMKPTVHPLLFIPASLHHHSPKHWHQPHDNNSDRPKHDSLTNLWFLVDFGK